MAALSHRDYEVLGLEISVEDVIRMQILQTHENLSRIVRPICLDDLIVLSDLAIETAALNVLELEVQIFFILEGAVDAHQEGTLLRLDINLSVCI